MSIRDNLVKQYGIGDFPAEFIDAFVAAGPAARGLLIRKLIEKPRGKPKFQMWGREINGQRGAIFSKSIRFPKNIDEYVNNFVERYKNVG